MRTLSLKTLAPMVCLLFLPLVPALCAGQQEAGLSDVQRLVGAKDYPAALKLLARIQRDHPELRDETQRYISLIIANQGKEYNLMLTQLIHVLYEEQDEEKAMQVIEEMRKLDPTRSLAEAKRSVGYVKFLKLMNSAAALMGQGKITEAIDLYLQPITDPGRAGFDMDKDVFDAAGYGNLVTSSAYDATQRIVKAATEAQSELSGLRGVDSALNALFSRPASAQSVQQVDQAFAPLTLVQQQERVVLSVAASLASLRRNIGEGPRAGSSSYLQYLVWLCQGRANKPSEGIAAAIRKLWVADVDREAATAAASASASLAAARKALDAGDLGGADGKLSDAYYRSLMAVKVISFAGAGLRPSDGWVFPPEEAARLKTLLQEMSASQEAAEESSSLRQLVSWQKASQALPAGAPQDLQALAAARTQAQALEDEAGRAEAEWMARAAQFARQAEAVPSLGSLAGTARSVAARFSSLNARLQALDLGYAIALARNEAGPFETRLADIVKTRLVGQDRMNGTVNGKAPPQDVFVERRPAEALRLFTDASTRLDGLEADMASFQTKWKSDRSYVVASSALNALLDGLDSTESKVAAQRSELTRLTQLAQEQHDQAVVKRKEGDLAFADGTRAFDRKQYDNAKLQLGDARDLYLDSLLLEEDAGIRRRYTVEIPSLFDRINKAIVDQYVAQVDVQVSAGRTAFSNGEFLKAFLILEAAQARWKATLGDRPNTYLDDLLEKVRNALRVSGGRDLGPEDSRAPAVNGFLNLAYGKVMQAEKLPKSDPSRKRLLTDAYKNVSSALDIAPVYRTAKALQLRIRKLEAPDDAAFRAEARSEIDSIIQEYHSHKGEPSRLYFDLKDYQDILPDYRPLKDTIAEMEVALGFRIRPPSPADIARSNQALAQAQTLYDPANSLTYDPVLGELDTAIRLNPNNAQAIALRRTILLKEGSPEASNISAADLAQFAESKRLYNTEDYGGAYRILQGLMTADKRNASYPPLAQLYLLTQQKLGLR